MLDYLRTVRLASVLLLAIAPAIANAQHPANSNSVYQQLRTLLPGSDVISVKNLTLKRDAGIFTFQSGNIAFYSAVNGKITGAVFIGEGHFHLTPTSAEERHNLAILTKSEEFDEDFDRVVLRFTDSTADELHKASAGSGTAGSDFASAARDLHSFQHTKLLDNTDLRLLQDVLSPTPGGYFFAAIHGKKDHDLFFTVDPHGAPNVAPEEVSLMNWTGWGEVYLTAFHAATDAAQSTGGDEHNEPYRIDHEDLDTTIEHNGFLSGVATVHLVALSDGLAVAPFDLYPTLRVSHVETGKGGSLDFVQEKKDEDADFGVVIAKPLNQGESTTIRITYAGKNVVMDEGGANYYPIARESWYPNAAQGLGDYTAYHMLFHVPKGLDLIATGARVNQTNEGKITTTEWKTEVPLAVVGFNLGKFTMKEATVQEKLGDSLTIDAYANTTPPAEFTNTAADLPTQDHSPELDNPAIGSINTASMLPVQLSQGQVAARLYTAYFGSIPFSRVALTQQFACNYGQSWPMLVYLPICGFLDTTQQEAFGLRPDDMYWKIVTPHEVAHQWWGQTVGFRSYRDQWMSEGFANESASIFLQATRPKPNDFLNFWKQQRDLITQKNSMGFRPIDVGPVTMGFRLITEKTGWNVYQNLVYPKGAYILHMIRMMMWSPKDSDAAFIVMMHDFVSTYTLKVATTEDFKAMVEKHITPAMDLDRNHKMDWFFNEYVYGTDLPVYHFESQVTPNANGTSLHFKLTQSGVDKGFRNLVPVYFQLDDGKIFRLGSIVITGSSTLEQTVQLPKFPAPIKEATINHNYDVLCTYN
ncbi:MAG TPA: M1 family aminopeptidase [Terracidiphilus sp.]|nr:M1 family aminopeptidase [Terracidiphilus sp.]